MSSFQDTLQTLTKMYKRDSTNGSPFMRQCAVERFSSPIFDVAFRQYLGSSVYDQVVVYCQEKITNPRSWRSYFKHLPDDSPIMATLHSLVPLYHYKYHNGCTYKITTPLFDRLDDIDLDLNSIQCAELTLPGEVCNFDIGDNADRERDFISISGMGIESVLATQSYMPASLNSKSCRDHFGVSADSNIRTISLIGFVRILKSSFEDYQDAEFIIPRGMYYALAIPDETMSIAEMLELNRSWLLRNIDKGSVGLDYNRVVVEITTLLIKIVKYLALPSSIKVIVSKTRQDPAKSVNKMAKQILKGCQYTSYIQLGGTTQYKTIRDTNADLSQKYQGSQKRPHLRRGCMAVRWKNNEHGEKVSQVVWVRPSIIHREMLSQDEQEMLHGYYTLN